VREGRELEKMPGTSMQLDTHTHTHVHTHTCTHKTRTHLLAQRLHIVAVGGDDVSVVQGGVDGSLVERRL
jgi:hypothetical protein